MSRRELPGLYWDEEKQRYFPLVHKPKDAPAQSTSASPEAPRPVRGLPSKSRGARDGSPDVEEHVAKRRRVDALHGGWRVMERIRSGVTGPLRRSCIHDVSTFSLAITSKCQEHTLGQTALTDFNLRFDGSSYYGLVGDKQGGLQIASGESSDMVFVPCHYFPDQVSSICSWDHRHVVASFGSPSKILLHNPDSYSSWMLLTLSTSVCHDVRVAAFRGNQLAMGSAKRALYVSDIHHDVRGSNLRSFHIGSDVLALHLDEHLLYTGSRNGMANRLDIRVNSNSGIELFHNRFLKTATPITHLQLINEWELLLSTMRGDFELHDLRFLRDPTPVLEFAGHKNSYTERLGVAVDPSHDAVFAAGQDGMIRAWSLHTGRQIKCPSHVTTVSGSNTLPGLLQRRFEMPIVAMQIIDSDKGPCLWAASGGKLYQYFIGQHGIHEGS